MKIGNVHKRTIKKKNKTSITNTRPRDLGERLLVERAFKSLSGETRRAGPTRRRIIRLWSFRRFARPAGRVLDGSVAAAGRPRASGLSPLLGTFSPRGLYRESVTHTAIAYKTVNAKIYRGAHRVLGVVSRVSQRGVPTRRT